MQKFSYVAQLLDGRKSILLAILEFLTALCQTENDDTKEIQVGPCTLPQSLKIGFTDGYVRCDG